jgi:hypothetical protein
MRLEHMVTLPPSAGSRTFVSKLARKEAGRHLQHFHHMQFRPLHVPAGET